jgi:hypothetical protein
MIRSLLYMVPFELEQYILRESVIDLKQDNYFKRQEVLHGKAISYLFLKDPKEISKALKQNQEQLPEQWNTIEKLMKNRDKNVVKNLKDTQYFNEQTAVVV